MEVPDQQMAIKFILMLYQHVCKITFTAQRRSSYSTILLGMRRATSKIQRGILLCFVVFPIRIRSLLTGKHLCGPCFLGKAGSSLAMLWKDQCGTRPQDQICIEKKTCRDHCHCLMPTAKKGCKLVGLGVSSISASQIHLAHCKL